MDNSYLLFFISALLCAANAFAEYDYKKDLKENCSSLSARIRPQNLNSSIIYQIQWRAFTNKGDIKSARRLIPHLSELGVDYLYLIPFVIEDYSKCDEFKNLSINKHIKPFKLIRSPYRQGSYFKVDPEFGNEGDVKDFVDSAHKAGMKVLFDLVYYHCGPSADFIETNPDFVERLPDGSIKKGRWGFPKLNFNNPKLREYLIGNMRYWIEEYGADGFRCDVSFLVPLSFWEEATKKLRKIKPDLVMLSEGERPRDQVEAFDINYCYAWQNALGKVFGFKEDAYLLRKVHQSFYKKFPKNALFMRTRENHDEARNYGENRPDKAWGKNAVEAMFVLNFTIDGIPMIYNGNEVADFARHNHNKFSEDEVSYQNIDWQNALLKSGRDRLAFMKNLIRIRKSNLALYEGNTIWLENSEPQNILVLRQRLWNGRKKRGQRE